MEFFHENDPWYHNSPQYRWNFCYMHGAAEEAIDLEQTERSLPWSPPDMFMCDTPMPTKAGVYRGTLYGCDVVMVVAPHMGSLSGRGAIDNPNAKGYAHAFDIDNWS